ncbi:MAG TPA: FAD-dependent monooxygenase, partial [Dissulfurispiraceae bacterium]|nr:FAD-dependent monooxygenase [Dissulfurispiraceae bacterium]
MIQNDKIYDVAIIGAGPGGATLAYLLIQFGLKVCLIDKDVFPRKKVCAGGLPVKILDVLPVDIASVIENEVSNVALTYKIGNEFFRE